VSGQSASQAEQAVAFAVRFGSGAFVQEATQAVDDGPEAYRDLVRDLRELPSSRFIWFQNLTHDMRPFSPVLGTAEVTYDDGSVLSVMVRTDFEPGSPIPFEIATTLDITSPCDPADQRQIGYALFTGSAVTRSEGLGPAAMLPSVIAAAQRYLAAGLSEATLGRHLGAALTEVSLEENVLDPTADGDVERLRETDEGYRQESDEFRAARAGRDQAAARGAGRKHPVGTAELRGLAQLLRSL